MNVKRFWNSDAKTRCLTMLIGVVVGAVASAQKPGGGGEPVPPGTIYFGRSDGSSWSMNAAGGGKAPAIAGVPSFQRHDGARWFLQSHFVEYETHGVDEWGNPNYWEVSNLVAVDDAGEVIPLAVVRGTYLWRPTWGKDDSFISFTSAVDEGGAISGGLFVAPIAWVNGRPSAGSPTMVLPAATSSWGEVNLYAHDWSPSGDQVVFNALLDDGFPWHLYVATLSGGATSTSHLSAGRSPTWSPDGLRIAHELDGPVGREIWTRKPDGTVPLQITQAVRTSTSQRVQTSPTWSPDGAHLAFREELIKGGRSTNNVLRIPAGGGTKTSMTSDGVSGSPRWRQ